MTVALQDQHAHFVERLKGLEQRMKPQEEQYLQATAPTRVQIIKEHILGPTTHVHPTTAQPENDIPAQVGQMVAGMHRSLSEHAARQAGDMRESMKQWLSEAHSIWNRPPPVPPQHVVAYTAGQPSSSGLDRTAQNMSQRAARGAEIHTAHEASSRRERSRSPQRASESKDAAAAVVKQRTTPARVTKPKPIPAPKPKKYGPTFGPETAPSTPTAPPLPPPVREKKRKEPESEERRPARARAIARARPASHLERPAATPAPLPTPVPAPPPAKRKRKEDSARPTRTRGTKRPREPEAEPEAEPGEAPPRKRKTKPARRARPFAIASL